MFPEACRGKSSIIAKVVLVIEPPVSALALKLIKAAQIEPGGNVLDVGHGTGESLILQLSDPDVPRPAHLSGITSLKSHYERSGKRIARLHSKPNISLYQGDAIYRPDVQGPHPLDPSSSSEPFTTILALDCAYHFDTRKLFLEQSFHRLAPGGRISLADICFSETALRSGWTRFFVSFFGLMPLANIVSPEEYTQCMKAIGYDDIRFEDISSDVFPGFSRFLRGRGWGWAVFASAIGWLGQSGMLFVVISGAKPSP